MIFYWNTNSGVRHVMLFPQSAADDEFIARLKHSCPSIAPGKFNTIDPSDRRMYVLSDDPRTHESEERLLHVFCSIQPDQRTTG